MPSSLVLRAQVLPDDITTFCQLFAAHQGYDFGEPSVRTPASFSCCNSQFKFNLLCFRSCFPIRVTLFIYTEMIDILFFHL